MQVRREREREDGGGGREASEVYAQCLEAKFLYGPYARSIHTRKRGMGKKEEKFFLGSQPSFLLLPLVAIGLAG